MAFELCPRLVAVGHSRHSGSCPESAYHCVHLILTISGSNDTYCAHPRAQLPPKLPSSLSVPFPLSLLLLKIISAGNVSCPSTTLISLPLSRSHVSSSGPPSSQTIRFLCPRRMWIPGHARLPDRGPDDALHCLKYLVPAPMVERPTPSRTFLSCFFFLSLFTFSLGAPPPSSPISLPATLRPGQTVPGLGGAYP
jgi:hypothetical protein